MVKIKFTDPAKEAEGFLALSTQFNVFCLPENTYEFAKSALSVLNQLGIHYHVIAEEGFDHAYHALRSSHASAMSSKRSISS
jgi:hypothetical protein